MTLIDPLKQDKMHHSYSNWVFIIKNIILCCSKPKHCKYGILAIVKSLFHSIRWRMIVQRLRYGNFIQSIVFQHSGHSGPACFLIGCPCPTTPVDRFFCNIIFGKCVSIYNKQMLAALSHHKIKLLVIVHIFDCTFLFYVLRKPCCNACRQTNNDNWLLEK